MWMEEICQGRAKAGTYKTARVSTLKIPSVPSFSPPTLVIFVCINPYTQHAKLMGLGSFQIPS